MSKTFQFSSSPCLEPASRTGLMEISKVHCKWGLFRLLFGFTVLCMSTGLESATPLSSQNESDRLSLLDFKKRITEDPLHIMNSWNASVHFCSWVGVTCDNSTNRVITLSLQNMQLVGSLAPSIGNLSYLTVINLRQNNFHGEIPQEMGRLQRLQLLHLSTNSFSGKIPANISHCKQLLFFNVISNKLTGSIPDQFSGLNLTYLWLQENNLTGKIPDWIGNYSSLNSLALGSNNFQGSIPKELGRITTMGSFLVSENNLSGMIPSSIYNISSVYLFSVTSNQLHGEIPHNVGVTLPNLEVFVGGVNKFTGSIPVSLGNASRLQKLDFAENSLTGRLPAETFGSLEWLDRVNFDDNLLGSGKAGDLDSLSSLVNCTNLEVLSFSRNHLGGELPRSIANLSTHMRILTMQSNFIHGSIPRGIGNLVNLTKLLFGYNSLSGSLHDEIGKLYKLGGMSLNDNKLTGVIPSALGNLTQVTRLFMQGNGFEGSIPPSFGNFQNMLILNLSSNNLNGSIPKEVIGLSALSICLSLSNNSLTGSLPDEVGKLKQLGELDVSGNKLSGEIPTALGNCISLERLHLEGNKFEGTIPQSLKELKGLEEMDISNNNLSGQIPKFLGQLRTLRHLNLSHNDFEGELTTEGIFSNASGLSLVGNHRLCGGIPELLLPACSSKSPSSRGLSSPKVIIPIICVLAIVFGLSCFIAAYLMMKKSRGTLETSSSYKESYSGISYSELHESTNGFSKDNLIGSGSFGTVYKGLLGSDRRVVAVKVINLKQQGASMSFIDECRALRSTRHRNLLKIITVCSSIDNHGNDFKSLVFEFMENGSLDPWLHPTNDEQFPIKRLSLIQRLNIAIDVASALDYLHHDSETSIVHCDLKPSNVLLDDDMVAHVGDFGLASFLLESSDNPSKSQTMSASLKGSIGYIPPEYGMGGQVSIQGDVYSYGVLVLEMFTGKRPTDDMFKDGLSIHQFTAMAFPDRVMDIVDTTLLLETVEDNDDDDDYNVEYSKDIQERSIAKYEEYPSPVKARKLEECLISVMQIGLSCSTALPSERILMNVVVNKMNAIREAYLKLPK